MTDPQHSSSVACGDVRDLAPEMGLGVLVGIDRARVLAHLDSCNSCRAVVYDMAGLGDSLLTLAPQLDPPPGFHTRLLAGQRASTPQQRARRPRWAVLALAAAVVVAAVAVGVDLGGQGDTGSQVTRAPIAAPGGGQLLAVATLAAQGQDQGQVFVYRGRPWWVFMTVDAGGPSRQVVCQLQMKDGTTVEVGSFTVSDGYRSWGSTITVDPGRIHAVRLLDARGRTTAEATVG